MATKVHHVALWGKGVGKDTKFTAKITASGGRRGGGLMSYGNVTRSSAKRLMLTLRAAKQSNSKKNFVRHGWSKTAPASRAVMGNVTLKGPGKKRK